MPNSLKTKFKKLAHDGKITDAEYLELCDKLDGHDAELRKEAYEEGYDAGWIDGSEGIQADDE